jgi:hypothetical protein
VTAGVGQGVESAGAAIFISASLSAGENAAYVALSGGSAEDAGKAFGIAFALGLATGVAGEAAGSLWALRGATNAVAASAEAEAASEAADQALDDAVAQRAAIRARPGGADDPASVGQGRWEGCRVNVSDQQLGDENEADAAVTRAQARAQKASENWDAAMSRADTKMSRFHSRVLRNGTLDPTDENAAAKAFLSTGARASIHVAWAGWGTVREILPKLNL